MSVLPPLVDRIERRLGVVGLSASAASEAAGLSKDAIRNIIRGANAGGGRQGISTNTLSALAIVLRTTPTWLMDGRGQEATHVPMAGKIVDGSMVFEAIEATLVDAPPDAREGTMALEVEGNSMFPAYEPGSLIYYNDKLAPEGLINRRCVIQAKDGHMYCRLLRAGTEPGLWTLQSLNPSFADIEDVSVEWAADIEFVKSPPLVKKPHPLDFR